jgi:hypothetical protein
MTEAEKVYIDRKATLEALEELRAEGVPILDQTIRMAAIRLREARDRLPGNHQQETPWRG